VGKLLAEGVAYRVDDPEFPDVYYDSAATGHFGYESHLDEQTMVALSRERGGDPDRPGKRHPVDALLWRTAREDEPSWESDLGPGRPGWHVECAAIALNRLGEQIDVNGGGSDLIFPHHEFGAAHAEAHTGVHPFARHYVHAGMIGLDGAKMSKSRGNLVFVSKLRAQGTDPNAIRLALLAGHYRADLSWT
jgi:L-cysteine:1D-myo-inositol 2-amino-2-deoxy-alpha-D-glucopyranoside ligase